MSSMSDLIFYIVGLKDEETLKIKTIEFELFDIGPLCFKTSGIWLPSETFNKVRKSQGLQGQHSSKGVLCSPSTQQKPSQVYQ